MHLIRPYIFRNNLLTYKSMKFDALITLLYYSTRYVRMLLKRDSRQESNTILQYSISHTRRMHVSIGVTEERPDLPCILGKHWMPFSRSNKDLGGVLATWANHTVKDTTHRQFTSFPVTLAPDAEDINGATKLASSHCLYIGKIQFTREWECLQWPSCQTGGHSQGREKTHNSGCRLRSATSYGEDYPRHCLFLLGYFLLAAIASGQFCWPTGSWLHDRGSCDCRWELLCTATTPRS